MLIIYQPLSEEINEIRKARKKALKKKLAKTFLPKSNSLSLPDNLENSMNDYSAQSLISTMEAPPLDISRVMLDEIKLVARYAEPEVLSDEQNQWKYQIRSGAKDPKKNFAKISHLSDDESEHENIKKEVLSLKQKFDQTEEKYLNYSGSNKRRVVWAGIGAGVAAVKQYGYWCVQHSKQYRESD
ncbi:9671_t:CDS:2 [Acaulospora morrowiae]|uniref:9671_t:CDS:1 n=1 Tax=Acaulospora morrowiae TaxID=94023 RepID=A0A9N9F3U7_9GLOM|nr:9671_t:CDS:2 [Acaulospora morrowiae]